MNICNYPGCKLAFKSRFNLSAHRKKCPHKNLIIQKKSTINEEKLVKKMNQMEKQQMLMNQQMCVMQKQIADGFIDMKKSSGHNINIGINNIILTAKLPSGGPKCFYDAIIDKLGSKQGNDRIAKLAADSDAVGIYKLLYPSDKMSENPVVYENKQFKFLSDDNQVTFGAEILLRVTKQVKAAMLYASNALIQTALEINKTERLYEYYNLGNIQGNALKEKQYKKQLSDYIKHQLICE